MDVLDRLKRSHGAILTVHTDVKDILHRIALCRNELAPRHTHAAVVKRFIPRVSKIDRAIRFYMHVWIGILVEAVGGDTLRRTAQRRVEGFDIEMIRPTSRHQAVRRCALFHRGSTTLEDLRRMPGNASGDAGEDRCVARAASQHHLCPMIEGPEIRLGPHHADDARRTVNHGLIERWRRLEGLDASFA
jgi:hypothetical protein